MFSSCYIWFTEITHFFFMCLIGEVWNKDKINKNVTYILGFVSFLTWATSEIFLLAEHLNLNELF